MSSDESEAYKNCDEDPGIIILYSSDENLHNLLSLAAVSSIANLERGATAAESALNFRTWLDTFITGIAKTRDCLVLNCNLKDRLVYHSKNVTEIGYISYMYYYI